MPTLEKHQTMQGPKRVKYSKLPTSPGPVGSKAPRAMTACKTSAAESERFRSSGTFCFASRTFTADASGKNFLEAPLSFPIQIYVASHDLRSD